MIVETMKFETYEDFYEELFDMNCVKEKYKNFVFRGEDSCNYSLLPSTLRLEEFDRLLDLGQIWNPGGGRNIFISDYLSAEFQILKRFYIAANDNGLRLPKSITFENAYLDINRHWSLSLAFEKKLKWLDDDMLEIAALAQHYGLPTRMLDFTFDIFTALYFATRGSYNDLKKNENLAIWALGYKSHRFYPTMVDKIPIKFVVPRYINNPNLRAQKGLFVLWVTEYDFTDMDNYPQIDRTPIDERLLKYDKKDQETLLYKFLIPKSEKLKIATYLSSQGYTAAKLFPGYKGVVEMLEEHSNQYHARELLTKEQNGTSNERHHHSSHGN